MVHFVVSLDQITFLYKNQLYAHSQLQEDITRKIYIHKAQSLYHVTILYPLGCPRAVVPHFRIPFLNYLEAARWLFIFLTV